MSGTRARAERAAYPTGVHYEVPADQLRNRAHEDRLRPSKPGEHVWIVLAVYRLADPTKAFDPTKVVHLDAENLGSIEGPGCFVCEQAYSEEVAARPCPGDPY